MDQKLKAIITLLFSTTLVSCSTFHSISNKTEDAITRTKIKKCNQAHYAPTNPNAVIITKRDHLNTNYKKIASISVNRYNFVGIKRQTAVINEILQTHAAKLGGNAIINFKYQKNIVMGEIVRAGIKS